MRLYACVCVHTHLCACTVMNDENTMWGHKEGQESMHMYVEFVDIYTTS